MEPQRKECIFGRYPDGVKEYKLLDLSIETLFIERSVYFDKSLMHESQEKHATTFVLSLLIDLEDDASIYSNLISNTSKFDSNKNEHACPDPHPIPDLDSSYDSVSLVRN